MKVHPINLAIFWVIVAFCYLLLAWKFGWPHKFFVFLLFFLIAFGNLFQADFPGDGDDDGTHP